MIVDGIDYQLAKIRPLKTIVYRYHNPAWAWDPTSGRGAELVGGRFNPKGTPALYASLEPETALKESVGNATIRVIEPCILCSYQVNLQNVMQFANAKTLFNTPWRKQLLEGIEPPGHKVCRHILAQKQCDALLVPSFQAKGGANLVCLNWDKQKVKLKDPNQRLRKLYGDMFVE